ncbi:extracellular solute-binding protein [Chryseoglobus sp. 28M-23]|uniref:ABC transporter substrate-binding protein n=1 Tax=Chryseoglobus sp. 28M-23 TaxID=2772253 RepID=UPI0017473F60|nr:extracellular solute-binding protein [Chryseoglobus sp. 28M-23]QOD93370.1 extracellular solute-binding protein [Chryseoglobus sp. 28M-23]
MRKSMRFAAGVSAVVLTIGVAGCTAGEPEDGDASSVTELNLPAVEAPWLGGYQAMVDLYEEETGITVNLTAFPFDGLRTQEANAAQSGSNAFDLLLINEQWVGQFYDNGWVQPVADVKPDFEWDEGLIQFDGIGRWDPDARATTPDGEVYSLPINGNIHEFMYRTDLYDQLGLDVPADWEGVIDNAEAARSAGAASNGYVVRGKTPSYDFSAVLYSYDGAWFADESGGDYTPTIDTDEFREALEMFKALADVGPAAPQTIAQAEAISLMQGGDTLQATLVTASSVPLEDPAASLIAGKVGYAALPGGTPVSGVWTMGVPVGLPADRAAAAMDFLQWLTSQETMQAWADAGGVTTRTDVSSDRPELQVLIESADAIRGGLRYPFTPAMLEVTDPALGLYLSGDVDLEATITAIQSGLDRVVEEAGFSQ